MNLIKRAVDSVRNLLVPSINIREVIPGWDDDYPEPMFDDDWRLTSEIDLSDDCSNWSFEDWLDNLRFNDVNNVFGEYFDTNNGSYDFKGFTEDEQNYLNLIDDCTGCKYFHGHQYNGNDLICGIHPYGNTNCSDFESKYETESSELFHEPDDYDLTEQDELIATYGYSKYEFVKDQDWISDDLEHYLGKYETNTEI